MLTDPVSLMLQKKSTTGLEAEAGDLEGAEFEVSYYDVDPQEVTNLSALKATGKAPLRTWVFKTNAKGRIQYDDSFKVSGDELYTMTDGTPSLPTGAITFKELTAPTSGKYLVNEETFFTTITGTESSQVVTLKSSYLKYLPTQD